MREYVLTPHEVAGKISNIFKDWVSLGRPTFDVFRIANEYGSPYETVIVFRLDSSRPGKYDTLVPEEYKDDCSCSDCCEISHMWRQPEVITDPPRNRLEKWLLEDLEDLQEAEK